MSVIPILLLCSMGLAGAALALFWFLVRQGDCTRSETLCLLPLQDDEPKAGPTRDLARAVGQSGLERDVSVREADPCRKDRILPGPDESV